MKSIYNEYYNFNLSKSILDKAYNKIRTIVFNSFLYKIWHRIDGDVSFYFTKGHGRLLDVGCNEGRCLEMYVKNGFDAYGIEINQKAYSLAKAKGLKVYNQAFEDYHATKPYDVIILSNVIEHTYDPITTIAHARSLLNENGRLLISCPNYDSVFRILFRSFWINWHVPFHLFHFNSDSISFLLKSCGFNKISIKNISPALWIASSIIVLIFGKYKKPTLQLRQLMIIFPLVIIIRFLLFPFLIIVNMFKKGDCLLITATK